MKTEIKEINKYVKNIQELWQKFQSEYLTLSPKIIESLFNKIFDSIKIINDDVLYLQQTSAEFKEVMNQAIYRAHVIQWKLELDNVQISIDKFLEKIPSQEGIAELSKTIKGYLSKITFNIEDKFILISHKKSLSHEEK
ncbi:MAG: hypothetical protein EPO11_03335, partial [Gammaproteobacteria bacterium]